MLALISPVPAPPASHKRPRGLWKGRKQPTALSRPSDNSKSARHSHASRAAPDSLRSDTTRKESLLSPYVSDLDDDDDLDDARSSSSGSSKRRRCSGPVHSSPDSQSSPLFSVYTASRSHTPLSDLYVPGFPLKYNAPTPILLPAPLITIEPFAMPTSHSSDQKEPLTADYEDWENLKELFTRAAERYDADDVAEALPLLRAVIRECHRFLKVHIDPSAIYMEPKRYYQSLSPDPMTPTDERLSRDWARDVDRALSANSSPLYRTPRTRPAEHPTAFHAIFGTALFFVGTLLASDPSLALPDEPKDAASFWLAALDVFETGENLPACTSGGYDSSDDWRMALVWGRTLVCLADEKVAHSIALARDAGAEPDASCYLPSASPFPAPEPTWPPDSPFATIAAARPPVPRRALIHAAGAHELMVLAMDQFSRGIFHMPHPHYPAAHNPAASPLLRAHNIGENHTVSSSGPGFSRPKELFTVASEVLGVAERLPGGAQRAYWAGWADSVFTQMRWEADMDAWRAPLMAARGRCWLVVGGARGEELEQSLERGEMDVLQTPEAEEARDGLAMAISFFERAKGSATSLASTEDVSPLLAEALLTLANLTMDNNKREELYSRAQTEAGTELDLAADSDVMDET